MADEMKSLKNSGAQGKITVVRASKLEESNTTGIVAAGILEKIEPNKFNPEKNDYFIRGTDDTLYILNDTATLKQQLGQPGILGMKVEVHYNGKKSSKKKGGKDFHDFEVFAAKAN